MTAKGKMDFRKHSFSCTENLKHFCDLYNLVAA